MKKYAFILLNLLFIPVLCTCSEDYTEVKFKVTCTGSIYPGEFTGYYVVDGGSTHEFPSESIEQIDTYTYSYTSKGFENFDELEIYARRIDYDADLIIRIYEDGNNVKTVTLAGDDDEDDSSIDYLIVTYSYEEGLEDEDDEDEEEE